MSRKLKVDPEFQLYLPAASDEAAKLLEQQLIADGGAKDAIVVWRGEDIILDGHRRHEICERLGLSYRVEERDFPDRDAAKAWMIAYQVGRRNLEPQAAAIAIAQMYELAGSAVKVQAQKAIAHVAKATGKSERSDWRAAAYKAALESLPADTRDQLLAAKPGMQAAVEFAKLPVEQQADVLEQWATGEYATFSGLMHGEDSTPRNSTDTVSERRNRPAVSAWKVCEKQLGAWYRTVSQLAEDHPGAKAKAVIKAAKDMFDMVEAWKESVK